MADQHSFEGSSTSNVSAESSESTVELNIKTLDSEIHSFHVDKNVTLQFSICCVCVLNYAIKLLLLDILILRIIKKRRQNCLSKF